MEPQECAAFVNHEIEKSIEPEVRGDDVEDGPGRGGSIGVREQTFGRLMEQVKSRAVG